MTFNEPVPDLQHARRLRSDPGAGIQEIGTMRSKLRAAGIRPTRQRISIASLLFGGGDRHVSAEALFEEARLSKAHISRATIYNCLKIFAKRKMIRQLFIGSTIAYYDTNASDHCHFVSEADGSIIDVPSNGMRYEVSGGVPEGLHVVDVQIFVKLRRKADGRTVPDGRHMARVVTSASDPNTTV